MLPTVEKMISIIDAINVNKVIACNFYIGVPSSSSSIRLERVHGDVDIEALMIDLTRIVCRLPISFNCAME